MLSVCSGISAQDDIATLHHLPGMSKQSQRLDSIRESPPAGSTPAIYGAYFIAIAMETAGTDLFFLMCTYNHIVSLHAAMITAMSVDPKSRLHRTREK